MKGIKVAPIEPTISFDDLDKIDIGVGTIELVEDVSLNKLPSVSSYKERSPP